LSSLHLNGCSCRIFFDGWRHIYVGDLSAFVNIVIPLYRDSRWLTAFRQLVAYLNYGSSEFASILVPSYTVSSWILAHASLHFFTAHNSSKEQKLSAYTLRQSSCLSHPQHQTRSRPSWSKSPPIRSRESCHHRRPIASGASLLPLVRVGVAGLHHAILVAGIRLRLANLRPIAARRAALIVLRLLVVAH